MDKKRQTDEISRNIKKVSIVILGKNEHFGLEEVMEIKERRTRTAQCHSLHASAFYISKEQFIHVVNQFKFSNAVIQE